MRFVYDRLTPAQLRAALKTLNMHPNAFCRVYGVNTQTMDDWLKGKPGKEIPIWVAPVLAMLQIPGALGAARKTASEMIRLDKDYPERGEYPYQPGRYVPDDERGA